MFYLTEQQRNDLIAKLMSDAGTDRETVTVTLDKHMTLKSVQKMAKAGNFNAKVRTDIRWAVRDKINKKSGKVQAPKLKCVRTKTLIDASEKHWYKHTGKTWEDGARLLCYAYPRAQKAQQETITQAEVDEFVANWVDDQCRYEKEDYKEGWNKVTNFGQIKIVN